MRKIINHIYSFGILIFISVLNVHATVYTVTSTGDAVSPGTLRNAITSANAGIGLDTIKFNITGVAPFTITLNSALPDITDPVYIDGYSQSGTSFASGSTPAVLSIVIKGYPGFGSNNSAIRLIDVGNCTVRGLVFNLCTDGVALLGANCFNNKISGNYFGLSYTGDGTSWSFSAHANGNGVTLGNGAHDNIIGGLTDAERNIISGNTFGITVSNHGTGNKIIGNFVGIDAYSANNASFYNATGITIVGSTTPIWIGGTTAGSRNIISGNYNAGISINTSDNVIVEGNYIGTDYTGSSARANALSNLYGGIQIFGGKHNRIGGTTAAARNVISGNTIGYGAVWICGQDGDSNYVFGNYIGLAADGVTALPNRYGVYLDGGATGKVMGNYIGNADGTGANTIAYNNTEGIIIDHVTTFNNRIFRNNIFCNAGTGIKLSNSGNGVKPPPVMSRASVNAVSGTAYPGDTIELFYADTILCPGRQGTTHFAYTVANASGFWRYENALPLYSTLVAMATTPGGNTSPFSDSIFVTNCSLAVLSAGKDISDACTNIPFPLAATAPTLSGQRGKWIAPDFVLVENIFSSTSNVTISETGNYSMVWQIKDTLNFCSVSDTMEISAIECKTGEITMYDAISPNNDNNNDVFVIKGIESFPDNKLKIFDREGNLLFDTNNYKNDWGGINKKGEPIPDGTYYYLFDYTNSENKDYHRKGFIVVKR